MQTLYIATILLLVSISATAQQYDTLVFEKDSIDENNQIYLLNNTYYYNYEILQEGKRKKLLTNSNKDFELAVVDANFSGIQHIKMEVKASRQNRRANQKQTNIAYHCEPVQSSYSITGLIENAENIWLHPIRDGFFRSLETAPFPYVQFPLKEGKRWRDAMQIGSHWSNPMWGEWKGSLLFKYTYTISSKETLDTSLGTLDCWVIDATAKSDLGITHLKSYFNENFGFVRFEYQLLNNLKVNLWLVKLSINAGKAANPFQELLKQK